MARDRIRLAVTLSPREARALERAAAASKLAPATWARQVLLRAAERAQADAEREERVRRAVEELEQLGPRGAPPRAAVVLARERAEDRWGERRDRDE